MHCVHCGGEISIEANFCRHCGEKVIREEHSIIERSEKPRESKEKAIESKTAFNDKALYYEEEWSRAKYFAISSIPNYDILVTKSNFYLLQFPSSSAGTIGCIIGLFLFTIIGAIIGAVIGNSIDRNKRKAYRSEWVNSNHELISSIYEKNIFYRISRDELKDRLTLNNNKYIVIKKRDERIFLRKNKKEFTRFKNFVDSYIKPEKIQQIESNINNTNLWLSIFFLILLIICIILFSSYENNPWISNFSFYVGFISFACMIAFFIMRKQKRKKINEN